MASLSRGLNFIPGKSITLLSWWARTAQRNGIGECFKTRMNAFPPSPYHHHKVLGIVVAGGGEEWGFFFILSLSFLCHGAHIAPCILTFISSCTHAEVSGVLECTLRERQMCVVPITFVPCRNQHMPRSTHHVVLQMCLQNLKV